MHRFEYRIGFFRVYSSEQWDAASKMEGVRTTCDVTRQLEKLPIEQCKLQYDVYACLIDANGEVKKISKHPAGTLSRNSLPEMYRELTKYSQAHSHPIFDRDAFNNWNYFVINSDEITEEIIAYQLKNLDDGID